MTARVEAAEGTTVAARLVKGSAAEAGDPFLVLASRGQGRTAYFAGDIGQSYFAAPYQYQRKLITGAMSWAAGKYGPPITVEAPLCVQTAFYGLDGGRRAVIHLLNEVNTTADRALPEGNPPLREEILPVGGIRVTFHGKRPRRVTLQPEGLELAVEGKEGETSVTVPSLQLHSMVVAELGEVGQ